MKAEGKGRTQLSTITVDGMIGKPAETSIATHRRPASQTRHRFRSVALTLRPRCSCGNTSRDQAQSITGTYQNTPVHTSTYQYTPVHTSTYRYIQYHPHGPVRDGEQRKRVTQHVISTGRAVQDTFIRS